MMCRHFLLYCFKSAVTISGDVISQRWQNVIIVSRIFRCPCWGEARELVKIWMSFGWRLLQSIWFLFLQNKRKKGPNQVLTGWAVNPFLLRVLVGEGETTEHQGQLMGKEGTENGKWIEFIYKCSLHLVCASHLSFWFLFLYDHWEKKKKKRILLVIKFIVLLCWCVDLWIKQAFPYFHS